MVPPSLCSHFRDGETETQGFRGLAWYPSPPDSQLALPASPQEPSSLPLGSDLHLRAILPGGGGFSATSRACGCVHPCPCSSICPSVCVMFPKANMALGFPEGEGLKQLHTALATGTSSSACRFQRAQATLVCYFASRGLQLTR